MGFACHHLVEDLWWNEVGERKLRINKTKVSVKLCCVKLVKEKLRIKPKIVKEKIN